MTKKIPILIFLIAVAFASCHKGDIVTTDHSVKLSFNADLIQFDTVFTNIGSATLNFKVKNTNKNAVKTNISLAGGSNSFFKLNVDGQPANTIKAKELRGNDSMYVFVVVTIDPRNQNNPFIIRDSIIFETNGNIQYVKLQAWGQDAYYFKDVGLSKTLPVDRPVVFVDYIQVPKDSTLIIPAGVKVYCHPGTIVDVFGTLQIQGTELNPVIIQGDRLERTTTYQKGPGQWQGILFRPGSTNNVINHTIIQNADFGIFDSLYNTLATATVPKLQIHKTIIRNMTLYGVVCLNSWINMDDVLIYNTGSEAFTAWGGKYNFVHCTLDNSRSVFDRQNPGLLISDSRLQLANGGYIGTTLNFVAVNDIVWGTLDDEIYLDVTNVKDTVIFSACDIKTKTYKLGTANFNTDPAYTNVSEEDFHLSKSSPLQNKGSNLLPYPVPDDIEDKAWGPRHPGCYFTIK